LNNGYTISKIFNTIMDMKRQRSPFKCLCDKHRIDYIWPATDKEVTNPGITIEEMAKALGYVDKKGDGQQSRLSQYENRQEGPPLDLVEKYAEFFKLDSAGKFDLFYAALESSNEIRIDITALRPNTEKVFVQFITAMILCKETGGLESANEYVPFEYQQGELNGAWGKLVAAIESFATAIKKHQLSYQTISKESSLTK
jgi:transcriptional regulator with XRE-family HTH domain